MMIMMAGSNGFNDWAEPCDFMYTGSFQERLLDIIVALNHEVKSLIFTKKKSLFWRLK